MNDSPKKNEAVRRLVLGFVACCVSLLLLDLIVHRHLSFAEGLLPVEGWFGFYAVYGFVSPYALIVIGSIPLRKLIMRSEEYYDG